MLCPLTKERLVLLAGRALTADDRALLATHLREPCDACLELLAGPAYEALLLELAGPAAEMDAAEKERALRKALPAVAPRPLLRRAGALVAAVALAASIALIAVRGRETAGVKGGGAPVVELIALIGRVQTPPVVGPRYAPGTHLGGGDVLLLRAHTSVPAFLYLLAERGGKTVVLWPAGPAPKRAAGELEISADGHALAVDPRELGGGRLILAGCDRPAPAEDLVSRKLAGCGVDSVEVAP
jgi:hypothetical protein